MFLDHNTTKLGANKRKLSRKSPDTWKLTNTLVNNWWDEGACQRTLGTFWIQIK